MSSPGVPLAEKRVASIAAVAATGAAWNLAMGVGSRVVALVGTLALTRFIAPAEYGEIAAANIALLTTMLATDASVGQFILARRAPADVCFHGFVLHMMTGLAGLGAVLLVAPRLGAWLEAPAMARFVPGFAVAALLDRVAYVPGRVLARDMRFRTIAVTRAAAELAFTAVALSLAPFIHGYGIVAGNVLRSAILVCVYVARAGKRTWFVPQRLRWSVVRDLLSFGLPLSAGTLAWFASANWDNLLVGRFYGAPTMGAFRLARNLADTPASNVAEQIGDVLLPSFAQMEVERRRRALVRAASVMALVVFPLCVGLAAVSPTLVRTLFDRRWAEMAPMLAILSVFSVARPMTWALTSFLQAQQRTRSLMALSFFNVTSMLVLAISIGKLGPYAICLAVGLAFCVHLAGMLTVAHVFEGLSVRAFAGGILRPLSATLPMGAAVLAVDGVLSHMGSGNRWPALVAQIAVGGLVYVGAAWIAARPIVEDVLRVTREALRRRVS